MSRQESLLCFSHHQVYNKQTRILENTENVFFCICVFCPSFLILKDSLFRSLINVGILNSGIGSHVDTKFTHNKLKALVVNVRGIGFH